MCEKIEIEERIISQAYRCEKEKQCLEKSGKACCKVVRHFAGRFYEVECPENNCPYLVYFADVTVCACPVRSELARKGIK